jgi:hypothetical protein
MFASADMWTYARRHVSRLEAVHVKFICSVEKWNKEIHDVKVGQRINLKAETLQKTAKSGYHLINIFLHKQQQRSLMKA